ncbi:hypothetical protein AZE42_11961 [Rhizopogon vesiculosus]|uniref:Uncharacterized protein n=1 Tax=Rhizopogon vesiculosus TaxID=180088 RepID=A0A1J8Q3S2_9AGAM|nr:hypothetical protein AZE42_11961 [Rhizopogon vesiculosus]
MVDAYPKTRNRHSWDPTTYLAVPEAIAQDDVEYPVQTMPRSVFAVALIICSLLAVSTGVWATCEACPNCDYDNISIQQGDACLNYWTCSGDTISCFYPSVENPGTFTECSYAPAGVSG